MISRRWTAPFFSLAVTLNMVFCSSVCQPGSGDRYRRQITALSTMSQLDKDEPNPNDRCYDFEYGDPERKIFCSPGYPNRNYSNNIQCFRVLEAPEQHLVRIDFWDRFKLENDCENDFLEVRDGAHGYDELRGTFCGSQFPPIITSSDRHLWLRFKTDENVEYDGFKIVYEFIPRPTNWTTPEKRPCHMNVSGEQGFINNSNIDEEILAFSKQHSLPIDCTWQITVKEGWKIQLTFKKFSLFRPNECENNFLDVFSNKTDIPSREKNFCGSIADTVNSKGNVMYIRFYAKPVANKSCFEALFTAYRENSNLECEEGEFNCEDTTCISSSLRCNGQENCRYRFDEDDCGVSTAKTG